MRDALSRLCRMYVANSQPSFPFPDRTAFRSSYRSRFLGLKDGLMETKPNAAETTNSTQKLTIWGILSLIAAVVFLYWPALGFDFVNWDDPWYVTNNDLIKSWSPSNLGRIATETVTRNYAPITILSFLMDHTLWGLHSTGYHLTNIVLHGLNGVLVFFLLVRLTRNRYIAWTTALLFLVHPVQVETVAWISSRKSLLSATFMLASLIYWFRENRSNKEEGIAILWLCAALLSKAIAVCVPPIVLMYDVLVRRKSVSEAFARQIVPGILAFLLLAVTMSSQTSIMGGLRDHLSLPKIQLLAVDTTLLWRYVGMLVWPRSQCVLYNPPTSGIALGVAFACLGLIAVGRAGWNARTKYPLVTLAIASFYLLFVPVLNLFPLTTLMNDRYLYLPSIAFFGLASGGLVWLFSNAREAIGETGVRASGIVLTCGVACMFMAATSSYLPVWRDSGTLWGHAMKEAPELMVVRIQQAYTLHASGRETEAMMTLQNALQQCPRESVDRPRVVALLKQWIMDSTKQDEKRRTQVLKVGASQPRSGF